MRQLCPGGKKRRGGGGKKEQAVPLLSAPTLRSILQHDEVHSSIQACHHLKCSNKILTSCKNRLLHSDRNLNMNTQQQCAIMIMTGCCRRKCIHSGTVLTIKHNYYDTLVSTFYTTCCKCTDSKKRSIVLLPLNPCQSYDYLNCIILDRTKSNTFFVNVFMKNLKVFFK